ncbi:endoplasmic reticulum-golgi intermediate compartment protein 3 [Pelomyxa schiedti]|nr:endoplasmic reticulum-golgi intermediate compartment protein 3 [Pelomyxa schiedti]
MRFVQKLDAYPRLIEDFRVRTLYGAAITIGCIVFLLWLFIGEFAAYRQITVYPEVVVDTTRDEMLKINFNITFNHLACGFLSVDSLDVSGEHHIDLQHDVFKRRLNKDGRPFSIPEKQQIPNAQSDEEQHQNVSTTEDCGSCYGAAPIGHCCKTCSEVKDLYKMKGWNFNPTNILQCIQEGVVKFDTSSSEGCNVYGFILVNKVAGNFHIAPGTSFQENMMHVHDLSSSKTVNVTHTIHKLSFGEEFPGMVNPLDNSLQIDETASSSFQFYIKVIPTTYKHLTSKEITSNQFSVAETVKDSSSNATLTQGKAYPGLYFYYDISPVRIEYVEDRQSLSSFVIRIIAVLGGLFTFAGLVDRFVHHSLNTLSKKIELGKQS